MPRLNPINPSNAPKDAQHLLDAAKRKLGMVPNILKTMAHSPAALGAYHSFGEAIANSAFSPAQREQLALAVSSRNGCDYCASAHAAVAGSLGLGKDEIQRSLEGEASDGLTDGALRFARALVDKQGRVSDEDINAARDAGLSDQHIVETVAITAQNIFTNYFNHVAQTELDFPPIRSTAAAGA